MSHRGGYILVGGKSSRFGSDKALIQIDGRSLVLRLADVARQAAGAVTLVGPPARYQHLGIPTIPDIIEDAGPLAGIFAALQNSAHAWNLIIACDMPFLTPVFLNFLFEIAEDSEAEAVVPVSPGGLLEPLCAIYAKRSAGTIREQVEGGVRKITRALDALEVRRVLPPEYAHLDAAGKVFTNVNTVEDLDASLT